MNKYLEKIAGFSIGEALQKTIKFGKDFSGVTHSSLKREAQILAEAQAKGRTAQQVFKEAETAKDNMIKARVLGGAGAVATTSAGFLGLHKYHQHKDNAIMAKIDSMYVDPNSNY